MFENEGSSNQKLPANITGAFFYPESSSKQKNAIAAELKAGTLVVFNREWTIVHQSEIDAILDKKGHDLLSLDLRKIKDAVANYFIIVAVQC
jgi:hypothetical protein